MSASSGGVAAPLRHHTFPGRNARPKRDTTAEILFPLS
jgi:hypothetical protein